MWYGSYCHRFFDMPAFSGNDYPVVYDRRGFDRFGRTWHAYYIIVLSGHWISNGGYQLFSVDWHGWESHFFVVDAAIDISGSLFVSIASILGTGWCMGQFPGGRYAGNNHNRLNVRVAIEEI